ncbi:Ig-like domain-containing protein [uncultured Duncaniella sp.]|uniref:Ig-like domain-containing protein n=1 Tax=uncultured Duncaniella sp. TaxID=2768039 RepID=UPI0025A951A7|nr:Ig-like domain-containing protein [uncultured Duncaniella sp.]
MHSVKQLRLLLVMVAAAVMVACANMGRPEGGPRDELPPVYVRSNPAMGQLNFNGNKITVDFDENIQLDDAMNKIVVSPAQRNTPAISSNGRRVTIELRDTIMPNTTYTIDFADAVKDLNEGNVLDGFAMDFATGDTIDTLRISGMVFEARTLEPAQGMLVGVYSNTSDTAISTLPFERITKTNQLGQFTLRNLKAGSYRVYALNDINRDYHWDRSEDVAFYDVTISPTSEPTVVTDTLTRSTGERDSLVTRNATRFLPDDLLLTWFNEGYTSQYLKDYKRPERNKITFQFGAKSDTLPILRLLNTHRAGDEISTWSTLDASPTLDTLTYWISDTSLVSLDSITIEATYLRTDTLDNLTWGTDTLKFNMRPEKKKKEKKKKNDEEEDSIPPVPHMELRISSGNSQDLHKGLTLTAGTPIQRFDTTAVKLEIQVDTLWYNIVPPSFSRPEPLHPMVFTAPYKWEEGSKYRLTIDSAAVVDIYGLDNVQLVHEFTTKKSEDYSAISFNVSGLDGRKGIVEVLSSSDKPVAAAPVNGSLATIQYLSPGTYYARLFIDANDDGEWTTGSIADSIQPEEVYYYPKKINLKKNWTIEQSWNINELPVDQQKPQEIKKNKPKRKKGDPDERPTDEEEEDEFFDDPFMNSATRNGNLTNGNSYDDNYRYRNY